MKTKDSQLTIRSIEAIPVVVPLCNPSNGRAAKSRTSTT